MSARHWILASLKAFRHQDLFRSAVFGWYQEHGRDLPWRRTRDPYAILVSEFMLQQTQVATVLPYYARWLRRFPNFHSLAAASEGEILHAWQGLGYYNRARNLHAAAKTISSKHGGECPTDIDELKALPGIGRYTASAIATFAFDRSAAIVEANIARLLARLFNITAPIDSSAGHAAVWARAAELVPERDAGVFNSALMDLGAVVCLPRAPQCGICPVKPFCQAKNPRTLPVKRSRPRTKNLSEAHALTMDRGRILLQQCKKRWRGMWMLPALTCLPEAKPIYASVFPFTHHRVSLKVFPRSATLVDKQSQRWFSKRALDSIPIPSPHRRAITALVSIPKN